MTSERQRVPILDRQITRTDVREVTAPTTQTYTWATYSNNPW